MVGVGLVRNYELVDGVDVFSLLRTPGRSLCQDVVLLLDLAQPAAQAHQLFAFGARQVLLPGSGPRSRPS